MGAEWKLVVLCWGEQHLGAQSTLQGDAFCFGLVFLRLNPNFSLQFVAPGGALDLQGVEGAANPPAGQALDGLGVWGCTGSAGRGAGRLAAAGF